MKIITVMEDTCGNGFCAFEHGLSVYVETKKHKILLDTGATGAFAENAKKLGIDLKAIDTVVLSHGHYDHSGGILTFAEYNRSAGIYVSTGADGAYYHGSRYIGIDRRILDLPQLIRVNGEYRIDEEISLFTGITGRRYWPQSNLLLEEEVDGKRQQDEFKHEQCLVIRQKEKSVLLSGCAHNGILNILDRYHEIYGGVPDVVISGFHMMKKGDYTKEEEAVIVKTAEELAAYDTVFYTGHCTGQKAYDLMKPVMREKLQPMHSGLVLMNEEEI